MPEDEISLAPPRHVGQCLGRYARYFRRSKRCDGNVARFELRGCASTSIRWTECYRAFDHGDLHVVDVIPNEEFGSNIHNPATMREHYERLSGVMLDVEISFAFVEYGFRTISTSGQAQNRT